jgi:hypothetical protein
VPEACPYNNYFDSDTFPLRALRVTWWKKTPDRSPAQQLTLARHGPCPDANTLQRLFLLLLSLEESTQRTCEILTHAALSTPRPKSFGGVNEGEFIRVPHLHRNFTPSSASAHRTQPKISRAQVLVAARGGAVEWSTTPQRRWSSFSATRAAGAVFLMPLSRSHHFVPYTAGRNRSWKSALVVVPLETTTVCSISYGGSY